MKQGIIVNPELSVTFNILSDSDALRDIFTKLLIGRYRRQGSDPMPISAINELESYGIICSSFV